MARELISTLNRELIRTMDRDTEVFRTTASVFKPKRRLYRIRPTKV